jgi:hypothetical protein
VVAFGSALGLILTFLPYGPFAPREATASPAFVSLIGSAAHVAGGQGATSLSLSGVTVSAGNTLLVAFSANTTACTPTASDGSNGLTRDVARASARGCTAIFRRHYPGGLSNATITVTHANTRWRAMTASQYSGVLAANPVDKTNSNTGSFNAAQTTSTGSVTPDQNESLMFGAVGISIATNTTPSHNWTNMTVPSSNGNTGQDATSGAGQGVGIFSGYHVQATAAAFTGSGSTTMTGGDYAAAIVAYKPEPPTDTTPPMVTITATDPSLITTQSVDVTWNASDESLASGTYQVRVGGIDCADGTALTNGGGNVNVAGSYTNSGESVTSTIRNSEFAEGPNTIRVCVTDSFANTGSATTSVTKDTTPPSVESITRAAASPTNAAIVEFAVEFSEPVSPVEASDFELDTTGVTGAGISGVSGSGDTYAVTVGTGSGDGTIRLDLEDGDGSIKDGAGNALSPSTHTGNETFTIDKTAPVVEITDTDPTLVSTQSIEVTWDAADANLDSGTYQVRVGGTNCTDGTALTDGDGTDNVTGPYTTSGQSVTSTIAASELSEGSNTIRVCVSDSASNTGSDTAEVTKDTEAPEVTISAPDAPVLLGGGDSVDVTFSADKTGDYTIRRASTGCTDGLVLVSSTAYPATGEPVTESVGSGALAEGDNEIRVCVTDAAGNTGFEVTPTVTKDTTPPVVTITETDPDPVSTQPVDITWEATDANLDSGTYQVRVGGTDCTGGTALTEGDGNVNVTGSYTVSGQSITSTVANSNLTEGENTVRVCVNDSVGNTGSDTSTVTKDLTPPEMDSINRHDPEEELTNTNTVIFRVTFSEDVTGVDDSDFTLTTAGTADGIVDDVTAQSGSVYDVTVASVTGDGTLRLDLNDGTGITDIAGNAIEEGFTAGQHYTIDNIPPAVTSINRQDPEDEHTNGDTVTFRVTFSEAVTGVSASSFELFGDVTGTIDAPSAVNGFTYDVTVSSLSGEGSLRLDLKDSGTGITDTAGNEPAEGFTDGEAYYRDATDPSVAIDFPVDEGTYGSIPDWNAGCADANPDVCGSASDDGAGLDRVWISIRRDTDDRYWSGSAFESIIEVQLEVVGLGEWSKSFSFSDFNNGDYTLRAVAEDKAGNSASVSVTFTIAKLDPDVAISFPEEGGNYRAETWDGGCAAPGICGTATDNSGEGLDKVEVSIRRDTDNAYWNGTEFEGSEQFHLADGTTTWTFLFPASNFPTDASYTVSGRVTDNAGNSTNALRTFKIDRDGPNVSYTFPDDEGVYNESSFLQGCSGTISDICGTASDDLTGVELVEFSLRKGASNYWDGDSFASASEVFVEADGTTEWSAEIPFTELTDGAYALTARATDSAGNATTLSPRGFTIDSTPPSVVSITRAGDDPTNAAEVDFTVTFSEEVESVATADFDLTTTGSISSASVSAVTGSGELRTVTGSTGSGDGTIRLDVEEDNSIADAAGNALDPPGFTDGETYTIDKTPPSVVSITRADDDPTNALSVDFTATFSEEVSPVGPDDFTLATTGVTDAEITDVTGSGDTYSVTVDTGSGDGTIRLDVDEDNSIADAAGNALDPPGFTEGEIYTIDKTEPTSAAVTHPADSISYNAAAYLAGCDDAVEEICGTAADNEGGSGLDVVEVSIQRNSDGFYWDGDAFLDTAGIPIFDEAAGTASWTYAIALPADGVYTVTARATDRAGNTLTGASNTFAVDTTAPEITLDAVATPTNDATPTFSGTAGTDTGDSEDITVTVYTGKDTSGAVVDTLATTRDPDTGEYSVAVQDALSDGTYTARASQQDNAGNAGISGARTFVVATEGPTVSATHTANANGWNDTSPVTVDVTAAPGSADLAELTCTVDDSAAALDPEFDAAAHAGGYAGELWVAGEGIHEVSCTAVDAASNTGGDSATVRIDTSEPVEAAVAFPLDFISYNAAAYLAGCDDAVEEVCGTAADNDGGSGLDAVEVSIQRNSDGFYWDGDAFLDTAGIPIFDEAAGTASWTYAIALPADGVYTVTARATDRAGNTLTGASNTFAVDTTAPEISAAAEPSLIKAGESSTVTFSADESGTYEVRVGGTDCAAGTVIDSGDYAAPGDATAIAGDTDLDEGANAIRVCVTDAAGNTGEATATVTLDTVAPAPAIIDPAADGTLTNDPTPTISGTAGTAAGDDDAVTLYLWNPGSESVTDPADQTHEDVAVSAGAWSQTLQELTAEGTYTVSVTQGDAAGNTGQATRTFTLDTTAPAVTLEEPAEGATVADSTPTFSGAAGDDAGDGTEITVTIYEGIGTEGAVVDTLTTDRMDDAYSVEATSPLASGTYTAQTSQSDVAGNTGLSDANSFNVEIDDPTVTLDQPEHNSATNNQRPTLSGSASVFGAEEEVTVTIYVGTSTAGDIEMILSTTREPISGLYSVTPASDLAEGTYTARAAQDDEFGNTGFSSANTFVIDVTPPAIMLNEMPSTRDNPTPSFAGTAGTASGDWEQVMVNVHSGTTISGELMQSLTTTRDAVTGEYTVTADPALPDGIYTAQAFQSDDAGNSGTSEARTFEIDTSGDAPPLEVTHLSQNHQRISPNTNSRKREMKLAVTFNREANWTLTITDPEEMAFSGAGSSGGGVFSVSGQGQTASPVWGGTVFSGTLADGHHYWVLEASDHQGDAITVLGWVVVDRVAPVITHQRVSRRPFRPPEHSAQRISFRTSEPTTSRVRIVRLGRVVATLSTPGRGRQFSARWDGRDRNGRLAAPGTYRVVIRSEDRAGNVTVNRALSFRVVVRSWTARGMDLAKPTAPQLSGRVGPPPRLPATGADLLPVLILALVLLGAGRLLARRRRVRAFGPYCGPEPQNPASQGRQRRHYHRRQHWR